MGSLAELWRVPCQRCGCEKRKHFDGGSIGACRACGSDACPDFLRMREPAEAARLTEIIEIDRARRRRRG